ncbi:MAG: hypothetical protein JJT99_09415 [Rhodobacteraceae bacterium]|nr:hypothetical protein [Paracoccaceae bacterium]
MRPAARLSAFVQDGLRHGHSAEELREALRANGWSEPEIDTALGDWSDQGLRLPVPRAQPSGNATEAVLYALLFFALLAVTWNVVALAFWLIEIWLPEPGARRGYGATRAMRWSMAVLIVLLPLFLLLYRRAEKAARSDPGLRRAPWRRRFGAVTLFLAALVLLGDAIAVVFAALIGDITAQFIAKAGFVALVAALVMMWFRHFLTDVDDAP